MKATIFLSTCMIAALALFAGACQKEPSNINAANGNTNMQGNMPGHPNMNGHDMSKMDHGTSAPDAASQPYDLQFLDSMTHHHEGAISMAQVALVKATRPELKSFAQKIIDDQKAEISEMKAWREKWYPGMPSALNLELPGMQMGKAMDESHTQDMESMQGKDFDLHFIEMMIPHHEGAIKMAQDALQRAEHSEIKTLAEEIIREQEAENKKMAAWKAAWK